MLFIANCTITSEKQIANYNSHLIYMSIAINQLKHFDISCQYVYLLEAHYSGWNDHSKDYHGWWHMDYTKDLHT